MSNALVDLLADLSVHKLDLVLADSRVSNFHMALFHAAGEFQFRQVRGVDAKTPVCERGFTLGSEAGLGARAHEQVTIREGDAVGGEVFFLAGRQEKATTGERGFQHLGDRGIDEGVGHRDTGAAREDG